MAPSKYGNQNSKGLCRQIAITFRKIEGYTPSGLGARLIPVDRQADENILNSLVGHLGTL